MSSLISECLKRDSFEFVKKNINIELILDFCWNYKVEVLMQADFQYHCYINYKEGDGAYSIELDPLSALILGIENFKKIQNPKNL